MSNHENASSTPRPGREPDSERPDDKFFDGTSWFMTLIAPATFRIGGMVRNRMMGGLMDVIVGAAIEYVGGKLALMRDPRYKVVVLRKEPGGLGRWLVVAVEFTEGKAEARAAQRRILERWRPGESYALVPEIRPRDLRRMIRETRTGKGVTR